MPQTHPSPPKKRGVSLRKKINKLDEIHLNSLSSNGQLIYIKVYLFGLYFRLVNCIILFVNCARTVRAERLGGPLPWLVPFTLIVPNLALTNNRNNEYYDPCDITTLFGIFFGTSKNQNLPELRYPLLVTPRLVYYVVSGSKHPWT